MPEPLTSTMVKSMLVDHVIDRAEAKKIVENRSDEAVTALLQDAGLGKDEAADMSKKVRALAGSANSFSFVAVGNDGQPDMSHELLFGVMSPDVGKGGAIDFKNYKGVKNMQSWSEFPDMLTQIKAQLAEARKKDPNAHVTLNLRVHGNNGTGFKLLGERDEVVDGKKVHIVSPSVASAAWINEQLEKAGLDPSDVTIVSEACNGGRSYWVSRNGFDAEDKEAIRTEVHKLGWQEKVAYEKTHVGETFREEKVKFFDTGVKKPDNRYTWVGYQKGVNFAAALPVYLAGKTSYKTVLTDHNHKIYAVSGNTVPMAAYNQFMKSPGRSSEGTNIFLPGKLVGSDKAWEVDQEVYKAANANLPPKA